MRIISIKNFAIQDLKVIKFLRFCDDRGYFSEHFRKSDFLENSEMNFFENVEFLQCNESFSLAGTLRGLHFQWNPYMGKLVRTIRGRMVDFALDIRLGSPTFGKIIAYDMSSHERDGCGEWIWIPPGFAHGNFFTESTTIEYFCSGEYSQGCEAGISPLAEDIDWSLCDENLKEEFKTFISRGILITEKDKNGFSIDTWKKDDRSKNFLYTEKRKI